MSLLGWLEDPPAGRGLHLLDADSGAWTPYPYTELARLTRRAASRLRGAGVGPGDRVLIVRAGSPEFIADFFGTLLLGSTPVQIAPPTTMRDQLAYLEHVRRIVRLVEPRVLVTTDDTTRALAPRAGDPPWPCAVLTAVPAEIEPLGSSTALPEIGTIQFSSGSTGHPRGVRVPFTALEAQTRTLYEWLRIDAADIYASWLPLHHDMGLLGLLLLPLWGASDLWMMRPEDFVRDPLTWLARFGTGSATMTSIPPFGMAHVTRRVRPGQLEGFDFSRWRGLVTGSERVDAGVVDAFLDLLGPFGLDRRAVTPAYGMAETTLAVTGIPVTDRLRTYDCDPTSLVLGQPVRPPDGAVEPVTLVGCGGPLPGMWARVVNDDGMEAPEDVLGEIEVGGESLAAGYLTADEGEIPFGDALRTGDAGFVHNGELFVVGRLGDAVKQFGRWYFAEDIESIALAHSPRSRQTVALAGTLAGRSTAAILVSGAVPDPELIGQAVARQSPGIRILVHSVRSGDIQRTTSGKPRRGLMWRRLAQGRHDRDRVWDSDAPEKAAPADLDTRVEPVVKVLREHAEAVDRDGVFPVESLNALRASGLMGLLVPREYGGLGGTLADLIAVGGQLAAACLSTAMMWTMHCQQVDTIARFGTTALRERLLPRIALDGAYLASVTAEKATGGDLLRAEEPLTAEGAGYRLVRTAPVVTGGRHADGYLVKMRSSPDAASHDVSLVYVDRAQAEVETGPGWDALGMRATENVSMRLSAVVPADQVVGGPGGFRRVAIEAFAPMAHLGWSAIWLGAARAAFSELLREIRAGRVRVDIHSELTASRIAAVRGRLEVVSAYLQTTLAEVTARQESGRSLEPAAVQIHLNTLKTLAAQETYAAADAMIALAGLRTGYLKGSRVALERLLRDLRAAGLTYDDSRLQVANGNLSLLDPAVTLAGSGDWIAQKEASGVE